ncbi:bacteriocin fulvocin C-related protein [Nonomuraea sp. NPDC047897]|uniref:bacteriocin fulvocin C-related protein n=1 Tax=Nonomuraea sp. NPDC047897 TaxID=3364346 RepID=UPI003710012C
MPLSSGEVKTWCEKALGRHCPWRPLLFTVSAAGIRVWTGLPLMTMLCRRIGARGSIRLLRALGGLDRVEDDARADGSLMAGLAGLLEVSRLLMGKGRAGVDPEVMEMRVWLDANRHRLPRTYDDIVVYPVSYRRMIYSQLSAAEKAAVMRDHLAHYAHSHPDLSDQQIAAINTAGAIFGDPALRASPRAAQVRTRLEEAHRAVADAFGDDEAMVILTMLGPPD